MDYNTFRSGGGYNVRATPSPAATSEAMEAAAQVRELDGKAGTFRELPVTGGVGPFHVNHFIGFGAITFLSQPAAIVAPYATRFHDEFVELFEPDNEAEAEWGKYDFRGADTIEFSLGGDDFETLEFLGGLFHSDWVSIQKIAGGESFYASTLRRDWLVEEERLALRTVLTQPALIAALFDFITVNQHHFLAGRRSFRVGYDATLHRLYVETAALERSSLCEYHLVEKTGLLRKTVIGLWTNLINNVRKSFGGLWMPSSAVRLKEKDKYQIEDGVEYRTAVFSTAAAAISQPWFAGVLDRNPGLLKGLSL